MLFWNTMLFDPFDQTFSERWRRLKTWQKTGGTGCVTKWWYRLGEKGWEVVSLSSLKGWLSPGDKQIRFDSPLPSLLRLHSPSPKRVPFLRKSGRCYFCHLITSSFFVAFLLSLLLFSILLVFSWSGQVPEQNCSRKSQGFSGILGKFLRVNLH